MKKIRYTLLITLGGFIVAVALTGATQYACRYFGYEFKSGANFSLLPHYLFLTLRALLGPILEEISFRLPMKSNPKSNYLYSGISTIGLLLLAKFGFDQLNLVLFVSLIVTILIPIAKINLSNSFLIILYTLLFSLIHNYSYLDIDNLYIHILIFLTHGFTGLMYAHLRLKFGVFSSCLSHIMMNSIPVLFSIIIHR